MADRNLGIANNVKTRFNISSMGKLITAILLMQLVEEELINLDDPISMHLDFFEHPRADDITVHHLLSHRSGLADFFYEQMEGRLDFFVSQREVLDHISKIELEFEPDNGFNYTNSGYLLLAEIIMKYRKDDYYKIEEERIFKPLGMINSYNSPSKYGPGSSINYLKDGSPALPARSISYRGGGGEKSTLGDLHKFMAAIGTEILLKPESWELIFKKHSLPEEATRKFGPNFLPYGYGCNITESPYEKEYTSKTIGVGGVGYGSSSSMTKFIDKGRIIIIWNNEFRPPMPSGLLEELAKL